MIARFTRSLVVFVCIAASGCATIRSQHHALLGFQAFDRNDPITAHSHFQKALTGSSQRADVMIMLGWCHFHLKEYQAAITAFQSIILRSDLTNQEFADAHYGLAWSLYQLGEYSRAYISLESAQTRVDLTANQELLAGWTAFAIDQFESADAHFRRASQQRVADAEAWFGIASCAYRLGAFDEAIRAATRSIHWDDQSARAYSLRGDAHVATGQIDAARNDYQSALERDPTDIVALRGLAIIVKPE